MQDSSLAARGRSRKATLPNGGLRIRRLSAVVMALGAVAGQGQNYPNKPIRVVTAESGGASDLALKTAQSTRRQDSHGDPRSRRCRVQINFGDLTAICRRLVGYPRLTEPRDPSASACANADTQNNLQQAAFSSG